MLADGRKFDLDLAKGQMAEKQVAEILRSAHVEVKCETYLWQRTGNICIEYEFNGKPSGIAATNADYWCHILKDENDIILGMLWFRTDVLKQICRNHYAAGRHISGGDEGLSKMVLIPVREVMRGFVKGCQPRGSGLRAKGHQAVKKSALSFVNN